MVQKATAALRRERYELGQCLRCAKQLKGKELLHSCCPGCRAENASAMAELRRNRRQEEVASG